MIECEFKCMKEFGRAATTKVKACGKIMNVCDDCLTILMDMCNVIIIEKDLN